MRAQSARLRQAALAVALAAAAFALGAFLASRSAAPPAAPLPAPATVERLLAAPLTDPAGQPATLARWRGKPLVVNFWATWCPPCLDEMPLFSRLQEKHPEVQFVGIAIDTRENLRAFAAGHSLSYPLLHGGDMAALLPELGNGRSGLPFTLTVDAAGRARHARLGALSAGESAQIVADLAAR